MPVYVIEFVIKLIVIYFENKIKSFLNVAKWILVNGLDNVVSRHTISTGNFDSRFTTWCQGIGM